jgi:SRSO17 transposase
MELEEVMPWADAFTAICARFEDLFVRSESRAQMQKYLRGLVAPVERKTTWQLAELAHDSAPDRMQRLLYRVPWDAEAARDRVEQFVSERFGEAEGIGVLDETGIPKKGTGSVGVATQYCGAVSKLANCQVATVLTYATSPGHVFLDRRLYLRGSLVPEPPASFAGTYSRECPFSDETRASCCHAGACLGSGSPDAVGDGGLHLRRVDTAAPDH